MSLTYEWKVNGATVQTNPGSSSLADTLDLSVLGNGDSGDTVSVTVTPNDSSVAGPAVSDSAIVAAFRGRPAHRLPFSLFGKQPSGVGCPVHRSPGGGADVGDLLLATVDVRQTTVATPAGWTLLAQDTFSAVALTKATYWRVATGSEPATYTFALGSARGASGAIVAYSGVDPSNPIDDSQAQQNANRSSITAPSVSASGAGDMLVVLYGLNVVTSIGQPAGMTERGEVANSAYAKGTTTEIADEGPLASAGASGHGLPPWPDGSLPTSGGWWPCVRPPPGRTPPTRPSPRACTPPRSPTPPVDLA